jgi:hypothetical protein
LTRSASVWRECSAKVTREIADQPVKSIVLEVAGHLPQLVSSFLMRALFTMFAGRWPAARAAVLPAATTPEEQTRNLSLMLEHPDHEQWRLRRFENLLKFNEAVCRGPPHSTAINGAAAKGIRADYAMWIGHLCTLLERALNPGTPQASITRLVPTLSAWFYPSIELLRAERQAAALNLPEPALLKPLKK